MEEITKNLLENVENEFKTSFKNSEKIANVYEKIKKGVADYNEANEFATEAGELLAKAFKNNVSSNVLPNGKMYHEMADEILNKTLGNNYDLISNVTKNVQLSLNKSAGISVKPLTPKINKNRINGLVNKVSNAENYDDVAWVLDEPIVNYSQSVVDDSIKVNVDFQGKVGLKPVIIRKLGGYCCDWCKALAGVYYYPDVPQDVYRKHRYCRCTVTYQPSKGKVQDVHSKKWIENNEE